MKTIIHVNKHMIAANAKDGGNRPVFTVKQGSKNTYGTSVFINGPSKMVNDGRQLKCGARVWLETKAEVIIENPQTWRDITDGKETV